MRDVFEMIVCEIRDRQNDLGNKCIRLKWHRQRSLFKNRIIEATASSSPPHFPVNPSNA